MDRLLNLGSCHFGVLLSHIPNSFTSTRDGLENYDNENRASVGLKDS